jgi:hypothetical protein
LEEPGDHLWEPIGLTDGTLLRGDRIDGDDREEETTQDNTATRRANVDTNCRAWRDKGGHWKGGKSCAVVSRPKRNIRAI